MKRILILSVLALLLVGCASAWTIEDSQNRCTGTVDFYSDGTGILNVTDGPVIDFKWYQSGDVIRAAYLFYSVDVHYNVDTDELYSPDVPGVVLKR